MTNRWWSCLLLVLVLLVSIVPDSILAAPLDDAILESSLFPTAQSPQLAASTLDLVQIIEGPAASGTGAFSATIEWTTDVPSNSSVEYGPTTAYGSLVERATESTMVHSIYLTGLTSNQLYHYRVRSGADGYEAVTSGDFTLATMARYTLSATPASLYAPHGSNATFTLTITRAPDFPATTLYVGSFVFPGFSAPVSAAYSPNNPIQATVSTITSTIPTGLLGIGEVYTMTFTIAQSFAYGMVYSNPVTFTVGHLGIPTNLTATLLDPPRAQLAWQDNSDVETRFEIQQEDDGSEIWTTVAEVPPDATTWTSDLLGDGRHSYRVRSCRDDDCSPWSSTNLVLVGETRLRILTLDASRSGSCPGGTDWTFLTGNAFAAVRAALQDPANFGPAGVVARSIEFLPPVHDLTSESLEGVDELLLAITPTPEEVAAIEWFVRQGGGLFVFRNTAASTFGTTFGAVAGGAGSGCASVSDPSSPMTAGPFGTVAGCIAPEYHNRFQDVGASGSAFLSDGAPVGASFTHGLGRAVLVCDEEWCITTVESGCAIGSGTATTTRLFLNAVAHLKPTQTSLGCLTVSTEFSGFAARTTTSLEATFDELPEGEIPSPIVDGSVSVSGPGLYIARPGGPADACCFSPHLITPLLTANGNETFDLTFIGISPTAVSFEATTNRFPPAMIRVFDEADVELGSFEVPLPPNTRGFLGITACQPIGRVQWEAVGGESEDTGIDQIRVGSINPPLAPSGLTATLLCPPRAQLTWQDNSVDETGFEIEHEDGGSGVWTTVATVPADTEAWTSGALGVGGHAFRVGSYLGAAHSAPTEPWGTVDVIPEAPSVSGAVRAWGVSRPYEDTPSRRALPNVEIGIWRSGGLFGQTTITSDPASEFTLSYPILCGDSLTSVLENPSLEVKWPALYHLAEFIPGSPVDVVLPASDQANAFFHAEKVSREYWQLELGVVLLMPLTVYVGDPSHEVRLQGGGRTGVSDATGFPLITFSPGTPQYADAVYHEFGHRMVIEQVGENLSRGQPDVYFQASGLDEGLADYFTAAYTGNSLVGAGIPSISARELDQENPVQFSVCNGSYREKGYYGSRIFGGALWDTREALASLGLEGPSVDRLVYDAIGSLRDVDPVDRTFLLFRDRLLTMSPLGDTPYREAVVNAFARHNIVDEPVVVCAFRPENLFIERSFSSQTQLIHATWTGVDGTAFYRLYRVPTGIDGGFGPGVIVADSLAGTSVVIEETDLVGTLAYAVSAIDFTGIEGPLSSQAAAVVGVPSFGEPRARPRLVLYPNPSSSRVAVEYDVDEELILQIDVVDVAGRAIRKLAQGAEIAGRLWWDGRDERGQEVPAGVYFVRLLGSAGQTSAPVVIVR